MLQLYEAAITTGAGDEAGAVGPGAAQRVATQQLQRDDNAVVLPLQAEDQHPQQHQ
jgi:hypothetical protein